MADNLTDWRLVESNEPSSSTRHKVADANSRSSQNDIKIKSSDVTNNDNNLYLFENEVAGQNVDVSSSATTDYSNEKSNLIYNNDDIFTEQNSLEYAVNDISNDVNIVAGAWAEAYGKIINGDEVESTTDVNGKNTYSRVNDVRSSGNSIIVGEQLLYTQIRDAVSSLDKKRSINSATGQGSDAKRNSYKEDTDSRPTGSASSDNSSSSNAGTLAFSPLGFNPYPELMQTVDLQVASLPGMNVLPNYAAKVDVDNSIAGASPVEAYSKSASEPTFPSFTDLIHEPTQYELKTYPDAMSNMYDVYFRIVTDDGQDDQELQSRIPVLNALLTSKLLSARITSIEIPSLERSTTSVSALGTAIDKAVDAISTPGKSSFTIRGDTRLYYIDAFNDLSGTAMGDIFNKGSAIYDALAELPLAQLVNKIRQEAEELEKQMQDKMESVQKSNEENMLVTASKLENIYAQSKNDTSAYELKAEAAEVAEKRGITQAEALKELLEDKEQELQRSLKSELSNVNSTTIEGKWAAWKAKRQERNAINSKLKESEKLVRELNKTYNDAVKAAHRAVESQEKVAARAEGELNRKRSKAAASIAISSKKEALNYITSALTKNTTIRAERAASIDDIINAPRIDIIVKRTPPSTRFITRLSDKKDERFVFENVKFLGTSNSIKFERESADPVDFTYDFIYKRFYKIDLYDTSSEWVNSQIDLFVDKVFDAMSGEIKNLIRNGNWDNANIGNAVKHGFSSLREATSLFR